MQLDKKVDHLQLTFSAMASPCFVLFDSLDVAKIKPLAEIAVTEVERIEAKYSRYKQDNLCARINNSAGQKVAIDAETVQLLLFAQRCYQLSDGLFDITSGVLRKVWHFDGSANIPEQLSINQILPLVGWQKVRFSKHDICLMPGMEIDFGGIAKEYAVSRVTQMLNEKMPALSFLVNFGGDIQVNQARQNNQGWQVGVEAVDQVATASTVINIEHGALATSGDAKRFLYKNGYRYSHILNPKTGWPVEHAPRSVTVAATECLQAGCLATLALLQGADAEAFLQAQKVKYWLT